MTLAGLAATYRSAWASIEFHQATAHQFDYLRRLGHEITRPITKQQASELIERHLKEGRTLPPT